MADLQRKGLAETLFFMVGTKEGPYRRTDLNLPVLHSGNK